MVPLLGLGTAVNVTVVPTLARLLPVIRTLKPGGGGGGGGTGGGGGGGGPPVFLAYLETGPQDPLR